MSCPQYHLQCLRVRCRGQHLQHLQLKIADDPSKNWRNTLFHCAKMTRPCRLYQWCTNGPTKLFCFQWNNSLSKYLLEPSPSFWIFVSPWPDFAHPLSVWQCLELPLAHKNHKMYTGNQQNMGKSRTTISWWKGLSLKKVGTNFCTPVHPLANHHYCILYDPYSEGHIPGIPGVCTIFRQGPCLILFGDLFHITFKYLLENYIPNSWMICLDVSEIGWSPKP
jgi:hypothetical protein